MKIKNMEKISIGIIILVVFLSAVSLYKIYYNHPYDLQYNIKISSISNKQLFVNLKLSNLSFKYKRDLKLYKSDILMKDINIIDSDGEKVNYIDKDNTIEIKNINKSSININYIADLGYLGKHGHRDAIYQNLITFDGGSVLLLPSVTYYGDDNEIKDAIKSISVEINKPEKLTSIMPVQGKLNNPTWYDFLNLRMSSYTIGDFKKYTFHKGKDVFNIYIDNENSNKYSDSDIEGLNNIYDFYSKLFNGPLHNFSLILLRNDPVDKDSIISGVGMKNIASSFNSNNLRDWQLMGHRMFHSFFDNNIRLQNFHYAPQLWFYEGLATYYENMSMNSLPKKIKERVGIDVNRSFSDLFERYVYMRLKDPYLYTMVPMDEAKINSQGKIEFLHYTQAPLIIKAIEDVTSRKSGTYDNVLKYIIKNKNNNINIREIIRSLLGDNSTQFINNYLYDDQIIPLWYLSAKSENQEYVIKQLNEFEYLLWTWFRLEIKDYPLDTIDTITSKGIDILSNIAIDRDLHFASVDIENKVNKLSPTVYKLLKIYSLRANVCDIDYLDPLLLFKLNENNNIQKWEKFKNEVLNK